MALSFTTALRNARLDQIVTALGASCLLRIYDGSVPANVGTALGAQVVLAEPVPAATFAPAAASGVLTANAIANDTSANATGTATFFRLLTSGGTAVVQGTVGTAGADLNLNTTSIVAAGIVSVTSLTITEANS